MLHDGPGLEHRATARIKRGRIAQRRSVLRELPPELPSSQGAFRLVDSLTGSSSSPSRLVARAEDLQRIRVGLEELAPNDREILILRYLLQLSVEEIAELLHISRTLVTTRHWRALERLRRILERPTTRRTIGVRLVWRKRWRLHSRWRCATPRRIPQRRVLRRCDRPVKMA